MKSNTNEEHAIILTGASGGIGFEIAKKFTNEGYRVFGLDIKEPKDNLNNFSFIKTDITSEAQIISAYRYVSQECRCIDAIISAAGIYDLNSLVEISEEDLIKMFNINVFAMYRVNKTFLPLLKSNGKVIMISSELGPLDPLPFTGLYGITKSTVEKYAYSLRMELQLLGHQVVLIRPGAVDTGLLNISEEKLQKFTKETKYYSYNSRKFKDVVDKVESKKIAPSKIANLIYKVNLKRNPKYVYKINRNFGLLLLNAMPQRFQNWIIKKILTSK